MSKNILWKAVDVIRDKGWFQGAFQDPHGEAVCALGAINYAQSGESARSFVSQADVELDDWYESERALEKAAYLHERAASTLLRVANELYPRENFPVKEEECDICKIVHKTGDSTKWDAVPIFNDHPLVTKEIMMHVFHHAAAQLDAEEESNEERS